MEDIEELKKELAEQTRLAEERLNQLKYLQADFDNFRRWSAKEKDMITALANEKLIHDLLVILDDFELALPSLEQEKNREGMEMIYKKFAKILSDYGLQPIDCVGKKFDPRFHEVLCTEKCPQEPEYDPGRLRERVPVEIQSHQALEGKDRRTCSRESW